MAFVCRCAFKQSFIKTAAILGDYDGYTGQ